MAPTMKCNADAARHHNAHSFRHIVINGLPDHCGVWEAGQPTPARPRRGGGGPVYDKLYGMSICGTHRYTYTCSQLLYQIVTPMSMYDENVCVYPVDYNAGFDTL